jgi:hypothetical protein
MGGFHFKETVMTGDPLDEMGNLGTSRASGGTLRKMISVWISNSTMGKRKREPTWKKMLA